MRVHNLLLSFLILEFIFLKPVIVNSHEHHHEPHNVYEADYENFVYHNDVYAGLEIDPNDFIEAPPSLNDECHFKTKINCFLGTWFQCTHPFLHCRHFSLIIFKYIPRILLHHV
jgi:hypothetical protein